MRYQPAIVLQWFLDNRLPVPSVEHRVCDSRRFRFDFAWPDERVALEVEGGAWTGGRHTRGIGFIRDMEKYNLAACLGWRVLRCVPSDLCTMDTVRMIHACLTISRASRFEPQQTPAEQMLRKTESGLSHPPTSSMRAED